MPLWLAGGPDARGPKQFVDFQNDVAASDILLAAREGFESVEHVKRYTAMGFGTDQGKLGNINGMAIPAQALASPSPRPAPPPTGRTTRRFRSAPSPGASWASSRPGAQDLLCMMARRARRAVRGRGQLEAALVLPAAGEDLHAAVRRECLAVRNGVGILDASTLGKIDIQGPDAVALLNWMYTNPWASSRSANAAMG